MGKSIAKRIAKAILNAGPKNITQIIFSPIQKGSILRDKTIIVTGGGRGIGLAISKKLISEGAIVIIAGRDEETLKKASVELGENCYYQVYDVCEVEAANSFLTRCRDMVNKQIDCLVCNAGISLHEGSYQNVTEAGFDQQFNTNFRGNYFLGKSFIEMKLQECTKNAQLLMISSETGDMVYDIPYGMTKAAINSMVGGLSRRVYRNGIRVNAVAPGVTVTDMTKEYADINNLTRDGQAAGRIFVPEEVAEVVCFLLSDASRCISGEIIHCNAGNHLTPFFE